MLSIIAVLFTFSQNKIDRLIKNSKANFLFIRYHGSFCNSCSSFSLKEIINVINEKYKNLGIYFIDNDVVQDTFLQKSIADKLGLKTKEINFIADDKNCFIPENSICLFNHLNSEILKANIHDEHQMENFFNKISEFKLYKIKNDSLLNKLTKKVHTLKFDNHSIYLTDNFGKLEYYQTSEYPWILKKSVYIKNAIPDYDSIIKNYLNPLNFCSIDTFKKISKEDMISFSEFDLNNNHIYLTVSVKYITKEKSDTFYLNDQAVISIFDKNLNFEKLLLFRNYFQDKICNSYPGILFKNDTAYLTQFYLNQNKFFIVRYILKGNYLTEDTTFKIKLNIKLKDELTSLFRTDKQIFFLHPTKNYQRTKIYLVDILNQKLIHIHTFKKGFIPASQNYYEKKCLVFIKLKNGKPSFYKMDLNNYKVSKIDLIEEITPEQLMSVKYKHIFMTPDYSYFLSPGKFHKTH